jgi:hypothetical protein
LTLTANDVRQVDVTAHLVGGEEKTIRTSLLNAQEHAKRFMKEGYWYSDDGVLSLHTVTRVDVHANSQEMRDLGQRLRDGR